VNALHTAVVAAGAEGVARILPPPAGRSHRSDCEHAVVHRVSRHRRDDVDIRKSPATPVRTSL